MNIHEQSSPYSIVHLTFWDHVQGPADTTHPLECQVIGILRSETKLAYYICSWVCDSNLSDSNSEVYCILKSAVVSYKELANGSPSRGKGGKSNDTRNAKRNKRAKKENSRNH